MNNLFSKTMDFRIVRIAERDAQLGTDHLKVLKDVIGQSEPMYPGILTWFRNKVVPGLKSGSRTAFIGYENERPIVTAVLKRGTHTKFCHLRIAQDFRDLHLGEAFFALMAVESRSRATEIHFTLPESLWAERKGFFQSFGFCEAKQAAAQYRIFDQELSCSAPFDTVWRNVLDKLPRIMNSFSINEYSMAPRLLFSIKPKYAEKVLGGQKTIEIRRRFSNKWSGERAALYSSQPTGALVGEAIIGEVKTATPKILWEAYGPRIACSESEFFAYADSSAELCAISLEGVLPYTERIPLSQVELLIQEDLIPPQSYCALEAGRPWAKAVSIAALLHGSIRRGVSSPSWRAGSSGQRHEQSPLLLV